MWGSVFCAIGNEREPKLYMYMYTGLLFFYEADDRSQIALNLPFLIVSAKVICFRPLAFSLEVCTSGSKATADGTGGARVSVTTS